MSRAVLMLCLLLLPWVAVARVAGPLQSTPASAVRDLASIRSSGELRVLVNQSRNSSGAVKGQSIGVEYQRLRAFEQYLNRNAADGKRLRLKLIPRAKDQLLGALQRGAGDLVAPGELLHKPMLASQRAAVAVEWVDRSLAVEDVLEMVQAGIFSMTAVELPIAQRWAKVMPKLRLDTQLVLASDGDMRWSLRREATMLGASLDAFLKGYRDPSDQDAAWASPWP